MEKHSGQSGEHTLSVVDGGRTGTVAVTGAAGFIGSHLVDRLLTSGNRVIGLDNLDPWYDPSAKLANLTDALPHPNFVLHRHDLVTTPPEHLVRLLGGVDVVYHLAGRPGVQDSWGAGFADTCSLNVLMTQRIMEAAIEAGVTRVVQASSSSVYGDSADHNKRAVAPISPYGASKVAAEQLAGVYGRRGLPVVSLRYFTVFGPRQRPDMAFHRLFQACLGGPAFPLRGDGSQRREFTFVGDVVAATERAGVRPLNAVAGRTFDVGGGCVVSLNQAIETVAQVADRHPLLNLQYQAPGDPGLTQADLTDAEAALGWRPGTPLEDGLRRQWDWHRSGRAATTEPQSKAVPARVEAAPGLRRHTT